MSIDQIAFTQGSQEGRGAGDHDLPYRFGWRPRTTAPYPFSTQEFARLLVLRSCIQAGLTASDDLDPE